MTPRRFRWRRLYRLLNEDPTGLVELTVAAAFVVLPGLGLGLGLTVLPELPSLYLAHLGVTERGLGAVGVLLGLAQCWAAGTGWYGVRSVVACNIAGAVSVLCLAYGFAGFLARQAVPMLLGLVLVEGFIVWRCWHERPGHARTGGADGGGQ
jgi:hypothetical protein